MFSLIIPFLWMGFVIFVQVFTFASSLFVDWNINFIIGVDTSLLGHMFRTCVFIISTLDVHMFGVNYYYYLVHEFNIIFEMIFGIHFE